MCPETQASPPIPRDLFVDPLSSTGRVCADPLGVDAEPGDARDARPKRVKKKKKKKKDECMRIGPVFRNDPEVRDDGQPYSFRASSPFMCPHTFRLLHGNVPSVNYARYAEGFPDAPAIPDWAHFQTTEARSEAARLGREHADRTAMLARWAPCYPPGAPTDDDFWCAVYRMEWLEQLRTQLEAMPNRMPRDAILQVALLQDMNQMRLLLMDSHGIYTRTGCERMVGPVAYVTHYGTSLASVMHCGLLPDLASIHARLPHWDKPTETFARMSVPFEHDELANALVRIFTKVILQPSKMRELSKCIYEEMSRMTARFMEQEAKRAHMRSLDPTLPTPPPRTPPAYRFMLILQRLIFCSLGGYYPHSKLIASAMMRRELYRRYMFDVMSMSEFKIWVIQNKRLLTMVLRENLLYNLSIMPGIESVFEGLYEFKNIRNKTLHAMETMRKTANGSLIGVLASVVDMFPPAGDGPASRRQVMRAQFPLRCAMLSNIGDVMWAFSAQFSDAGAGTALHAMLRRMFWRSTPMNTAEALLERFGVSDDIASLTMERHLRTIVLYWLIMKDRCVDQSMKKTDENYDRCTSKIGRDGVYLLPDFPSGKKTKRTGSRRDKTGVICDVVVRAEAAAAETSIRAHLMCVRHDCEITECSCLEDTILAIVEKFSIYRFMLPSLWGLRSVPVGEGIEQYMWQMYDACLVWCYRPRQTPFAEEIVGSAATVCNVFTTPESLAAEQNTSVSDAIRREFIEFHRAHTAFKLSRDKIHAHMTEVVNSYPPDWGFSFEWLMSKYKITMFSVKQMDEGYVSMMGESHHKHPYNSMLRIARLEPRDFWIIRLFYKIVHRRESIRVYPLWADLARQQIQAIHEQTNAVCSGERLPDVLGRIYYCPSHRRVLSPIVGADLGKRGRINTHAVDMDKIVIDPLSLTKYCGVRTGRIKRRCVHDHNGVPTNGAIPDDTEEIDAVINKLPPKLRKMFKGDGTAAGKAAGEDGGDDDADDPDEESEEEEEEGDVLGSDGSGADTDTSRDSAPGTGKRGAQAGKGKGARKRRTKKKNYTRCGIVPAESVPMIGVMLMLYNTLYMLCPFCGHVMRYGRDKCTEIGLWCGACTRGEKAMAERLNILWDEVNQCADPQLIPSTICGVRVAKTWHAECYYCGVQPPATRPLRYHLIYNDLVIKNGAPLGLVYIGLCDHHAKWWIGRDVETMRLSTILLNFRMQDAARLQEDIEAMRRVIPRTYTDDMGNAVVSISVPFEDTFEMFRDETLAFQQREATQKTQAKHRRLTHNKVKRALKGGGEKRKSKNKDKKGKGKAPATPEEIDE